MGVLETAMKIANQDADAEDDEEEDGQGAAKVKKLNKTMKALLNGQIVIVQPRSLAGCLLTKARNVFFLSSQLLL